MTASIPPPPVWSAPVELPHHPYRFVPVPRAANRRDGWTSDRQHAFVWALARLPSVAAAARSVGMSARSAYRLRAAVGAESFAQAWDDALEIGLDRARDSALERATAGEDVPVLWRGRVIDRKKRYNDRLLIAALSAVRAEAQDLVLRRREIAARRTVRASNLRHGGPPDWHAADRARAAEEEAAAKARAETEEWLKANPPRPLQPRCRLL